MNCIQNNLSLTAIQSSTIIKMNEEMCPQCLKTMKCSASRLVQDSCGHKKCRMCLLVDETGCRLCQKIIADTDNTTLNQQLVKQTINVIRYHPNDNNQVSVLKASNSDNVKQNTNSETSMKIKSNRKRTKLQLKCDICGQEFRRRSHLEWHLRRHTGERPFACDHCGKSFTQKSKLNTHRKLHSDERPFTCNKCKKSFQTKSGLLSHNRTHTGEKPFACKQCSAKFSELSNLNKHLTVHTKEKPYMCADCGARFSLKWRLTVHLRIHSRERPYSCSSCTRAFNNLKDLNRHKITHSDSKPFKCSVCSTYFRRKDNLERHMKNTHPEITKTEVPPAVVAVEEETEDETIKKTEPTERIADKPVEAQQKTVIINRKIPEVIPQQPSLPTNAVSVINGPVKLACKTKDFKDNYKIVRAEPEERNVDIYKCILSPMVTSGTYRSSATSGGQIFPPIRNTETETPTSCSKMAPIVPPIHYETSFESGQHAIIKNIKFKLPPDYTSNLSKFNALQEQNRGNAFIADKQNCVRTITKVPVGIEENGVVEVPQHWRKRTSQIYSID